MAKNIKATKKFEKKHLKGVLERRKNSAKVKQQVQLKAKKQVKRAKDAEYFKAQKDDGAVGKSASRQSNAKVNDMSVDDFFKGGFEILEKGKGKSGRISSAKLGKRKRAEPQEDGESHSDSDSSLSEGGAPVESDSEEGSELEDTDDAGMSRSAMDALAEKDPDFYKFLKENDPEALDFDENLDLAEVDDLSASDGEEEQPKKKRKKGKSRAEESDESQDEFATSNELTRPMVAKWKDLLTTKQSLRAARQVVLAFRCAAHLNEADEDNQQRYTINSPEVFHDVLMVALKQIPDVLQHHVPVKESAAHKVSVATDTKKFKTLSMLVRSFTASILHLLGTLSDDATLKLTLSALTPLLPYLLSIRKVLKNLIKTVVNFWGQPSSSESTRITAFLVLRRLMVIGDKGIREAVLKATYQGLIQGSRTTNANTIQGINLMKNSAAELWGIDQGIGYTTAFSFIRQLAIHLRNSIVHNQNDAFRKVYNWQYIHSLDFWSCVLAEHCSSLKEAESQGKESQLKLLIYPLVQVTLGAMRLIPTSIYFPLRFHLIRSLLRISRATGTYIPLASAMLEVLNSAEMKKPAKPSTLKQLDFHINYKAPKSYLRTAVYQNGVGEQVVELLSEYFVLWSTNIAFPEFSLPVIIMVKRWLKDARKKSGNKNGKLISSLVLLVQKLEANGKFIEEKRAKVDFAPKDRTQVDAFLKDFEWEKTPVGAFVVGQRKQRAEKAAVLEQARLEEQKKRKAEEQEALRDGEQDEGEEDEEASDVEMNGVEHDEDEDDTTDHEE